MVVLLHESLPRRRPDVPEFGRPVCGGGEKGVRTLGDDVGHLALVPPQLLLAPPRPKVPHLAHPVGRARGKVVGAEGGHGPDSPLVLGALPDKLLVYGALWRRVVG